MGADQTRADLLQAASDAMIAARSINISLKDVGERVGLSAPLIQYHFGSKEGLLLALVERDATQAVGMLRELESLPIPADRKMRMHIEGFVKSFHRAPYLNVLLHSQMQSANDVVAKKVSEVFVSPIAAFQRKILEQGIDDGVFRPVDPTCFYFIVVGACEHIFAHRGALCHVFGVSEISDDMRKLYSKTAIDIILGGLLSP